MSDDVVILLFWVLYLLLLSTILHFYSVKLLWNSGGIVETCFSALLDWTTPAFGVCIFSWLKQNPPMGLTLPDPLCIMTFFPLCTVEVPTILAWGSFEDGSTRSCGIVLPELQAYSSACAPISPQLRAWGGPLQTLETQSLSSPWFLALQSLTHSLQNPHSVSCHHGNL